METGVAIDGSVRSQVSKVLVGLHAEHYGKGATQAKTYAVGDVLVTVFRDCLTPMERTLVASHRPDAVRDVRSAFHAAMAETFVGAVERLTGRRVLSFLPQVDPVANLSVAVFVLDERD